VPGVYRRRFFGPRRNVDRSRWTSGANTKLYLHDAAVSVGGVLPATGSSQSATTPTRTATGAGTNRLMDKTIGVAQTSVTTNVTAGDTTVWHRRYVTPSLQAQPIPAGNWTIDAASSESVATVNATFNGGVLYLWRPSTGARVGYIFDQPTVGATEPSTTETNVVTVVAGSAVTVLDGDVLIFETWNDFASSGTGTVTAYYDGTTEDSASNNAAYIKAPTGIDFLTVKSFVYPGKIGRRIGAL